MSGQELIPRRPTVSELAAQASDDSRTFLDNGEVSLTAHALMTRVDALARGLMDLGIGRGTRVAIAMANHLDHVCLFFALIRLGAIQIPLNIQLKSDGLDYILSHSDAKYLLADTTLRDQLQLSIERLALSCTWCDPGDPEWFETLYVAGGDPPAYPQSNADDVVSVMYTSGTTGPPKGVLVTDRMFRAAARACAIIGDFRNDDVVYSWYPLYHIGAGQVLIAALGYNITVRMTARFSASRFWDEVRECGATQIHYLGGVLHILLKQTASPRDRDHRVRIAWGGGAPVTVWRLFENRFGLAVRECYGMTEASSFTTINVDGVVGSVGRALPWFEVKVVDGEGNPCAPGVDGEILTRAVQPGTITPGYYRDDEANRNTFVAGWLRTGDLGHADETGLLYYAGRLKDNIRRRGENISGREIERVVDQLDWVKACAAIGVPDELDDESIKLLVIVQPGTTGDGAALFAHCEQHLARFQVPRYIEFVSAFETTATQRIKKERLSRDIDGCWERLADGRVVSPAEV